MEHISKAYIPMIMIFTKLEGILVKMIIRQHESEIWITVGIEYLSLGYVAIKLYFRGECEGLTSNNLGDHMLFHPPKRYTSLHHCNFYIKILSMSAKNNKNVLILILPTSSHMLYHARV